jgi:hypothetical protein
MWEIRAEEGNLVDLLRRCVRDGDAEGVVALMSCLADFWTIEGSHLKVVTISPEIEELVAGATVDPAYDDALRITLVAMAFNSLIFSDSADGAAFDRLEELGPGGSTSRSEITTRVMLVARQGSAEGWLDGIEELCDDPNREVARLAMQWSSQFHENQGEVELAQHRARQALELALLDESSGPWLAALVRAQLAGLMMQLGDLGHAMEHATAAIPVMEALGAWEDAAQLKAVLALGALEDGRIAEAERRFDEIEAEEAGLGIFGAAIILLCGRPEVDLAAGRIDEGLLGFRDAVTALASRSFPGLSSVIGYEPWTMYAESAAVAAHVLHGHPQDIAVVHRDLLRKAQAVLGDIDRFLDYPVYGSALFALSVWELVTDPPVERAAIAVRLLVYADRFGYNRQLPSLKWAPALALAEAALPGEEARVRAEVESRKPTELREEVGDLLAELVEIVG